MMNRIEVLKDLFRTSRLSELFRIRKEDDYPDRGFSSLRFKTNDLRIRAIEIWNKNNEDIFRVYHAENMAEEIKELINSIKGYRKSNRNVTDYAGDFLSIAQELFLLFSSDTVIDAAANNPVLTTNSLYQGLSLPDVDTSDAEDVIGRIFSWREILAINEDMSDKNALRKALSKTGVYLQRSADGKSRYIGSAYSTGGVFSRWLRHLKSNGDAKHLNLFILENGYSEVVFTVLEFIDKKKAVQAESKWKNILGTKNSGPYDGARLNSN